MEDQIVTVSYLAEPGPQHTGATLAAALNRAEELGLQHVVVATDSGRTARLALDAFGEDFSVVAVTNSEKLRLPIDKLHDYTEGFRRYREELRAKGVEAIPVGMTDEAMEELRAQGAVVSRIDWARINKFVRRDINCLDCIGVAVRVALACAIWARLEEQVPVGADVVAIAGTGFGGGGADTAIIVRTASVWKNFRVLETILRPRESPPSMLNK
jgi:uncharacterized protein